jgi:hypothetical protein
LFIADERTFADRVNAEIVPAVRSVGAKLAVGGRNIVGRFGEVIAADFLSDCILDHARIAAESLNR